MMYYYGRGVPLDFVEAEGWFRKAAEQGDATAQEYLGYMHYRGQGVQEDYAEAARWYRKAAEQGHEPAQRALDDLLRKMKAAKQEGPRRQRGEQLQSQPTK
jgi:TPR repeat protein